MRLNEYSIDELHVLALAEHDEDDVAVQIFNETYARLRAEYLAVFERLRELREARP